jgi:hypothetical protein
MRIRELSGFREVIRHCIRNASTFADLCRFDIRISRDAGHREMLALKLLGISAVIASSRSRIGRELLRFEAVHEP